MPIKSIHVASFFSFLLLFGCASYKEIKTVEPVETFAVDGAKAKDLSACVFEVFREENSGTWDLHPSRAFDYLSKKWFVSLEFKSLVGGGVGIYHSSISFQDVGNQTEIQIRSQMSGKRPYANVQEIKNQVSICQAAL